MTMSFHSTCTSTCTEFRPSENHYLTNDSWDIASFCSVHIYKILYLTLDYMDLMFTHISNMNITHRYVNLFHSPTSIVESKIMSAPVDSVIYWLLIMKSRGHKVSGICSKTGVWVSLWLTHLSLSALVVKEVECKGSSWQSSAEHWRRGSVCCKPGKPAHYLCDHSHPSLPRCQTPLPRNELQRALSTLQSNQPSALGVR